MTITNFVYNNKLVFDETGTPSAKTLSIQLSTMAEIGNGTTKAISVILSNGDANNFIFGAYTFSEETKQVRV